MMDKVLEEHLYRYFVLSVFEVSILLMMDKVLEVTLILSALVVIVCFNPSYDG